VEDHFWGQSVANLEPPYDVVIGTDIVYREDIIQPLVDSVTALSSPETLVIIANEIRSRRLAHCFLSFPETPQCQTLLLPPPHCVKPRILDIYFKTITERFKFQKLSLSQVDDKFDTSVYEAYTFKLKKQPAAQHQEAPQDPAPS